VKQTEIEDLQRHAGALEKEVARLRAANLGERQRSWGTMREDRYRTLFDSIDEGFCIIEFLDGPPGPLSDYIHIEANAAYARHTGIANVVGQKVRDMVPDEAEGWVEPYSGVLRTGKPHSLRTRLGCHGTSPRTCGVSDGACQPAASGRAVAGHHPRKRAEGALQQLNETLEVRVADGRGTAIGQRSAGLSGRGR
jgi:PAS domain-containing protein